MAIATRTSLRTAWKESPAVIRAMGDGKHFLLLSRDAAGAHEREARLVIQHLEFFLMPAREESRDAIRPEFHSYLEGPAEDGDTVVLRYKVVVTEGLMVMEGAQLQGLDPYHIWTEDHVRSQTRWDPLDPAFLVTCKVQKLDPPIEIPRRPGYDDAEHWVEIQEAELPATSFTPAVEHVDYLKVVVEVKKALAEAQKNPMDRPEPEPKPKPAPPPPPKPAAAATPAEKPPATPSS